MAKQVSKVKKKNVKEEEVTNQYNIKSIIVLIICVLVVFFGFYLFTLRMTKKNDTSTDEKTTEEVNISYDTIMLGQSLSMGDESYYVLFYDFSDDDTSSVYQNLFTNYKSKKELPIYRVDMSSGFNKNYLTEGEANYNPSSIAEFSIKGATLMKIDNHEVVDYIDGEGNITNLLS